MGKVIDTTIDTTFDKTTRAQITDKNSLEKLAQSVSGIRGQQLLQGGALILTNKNL